MQPLPVGAVFSVGAESGASVRRRELPDARRWTTRTAGHVEEGVLDAGGGPVGDLVAPRAGEVFAEDDENVAVLSGLHTVDILTNVVCWRKTPIQTVK